MTDWSSDVDTLVKACAYAIRTTTLAQGLYSPTQLAFGYDMLFRQKMAFVIGIALKSLQIGFSPNVRPKHNINRISVKHDYN